MILALAAPRLAHALHGLRAFAAGLLVVLVMAGIPGSSLRLVAADLEAPPVPDSVKDRDGALDITVRDGHGGPPIAGASVRAYALIAEKAYLAGARATDAAGLTQLSELPRGEAWVVVDAPGHARASTRVVVEAGGRALVLELGPPHSLDVVVRDEVGAPIAGAELEIIQPGDPLPIGARSDGKGAAHVDRLSAGPWHVTARVPGYEDGLGRASRDGEIVRFVLRKLGGIDVEVIGADDRPVSRAHVEIAGATLWPARSTVADDRGKVLLGSLRAGSYAIRATAGDQVSPIELGVMLARGEQKTVVLHVAPGRFVSVRVTDGSADDADPIRAARVTLVEGGVSPFPFEATTDANGRARLGPMGPGSATLGVRADGFVGRGGVLVANPVPPETHVDLVRAGALEGRVVDARGYPVDGATIEIVGTDPGGAPIYDDPSRSTFQSAHFDAMLGGPAPLVPSGELGVVPGPVPAIPHDTMASAGGGAAMVVAGLGLPAEPWVTRDDGTFRATPASPGRVRAIVHHPQFVEAQSEIVTLAPGGTAHVDVVMHAGGTLEGRVVDVRDRPVADARILVSAVRGSLERTSRTASDGTFAFAAMPDQVVLTASVEDDDAQPEARMVVTIPEGERKEVVVHLPEPRDPLPVSVVDGRGLGIDAAQVSVSSLSADLPLRTTAFTDRDGAAALKRARGVALRVEVNAPGFAPRVVGTVGTEAELKIELAPAESAHGTVVTARGRDPVVGAEVTLATDLGVRRVRTGGSGDFVIAGLASGNARMRVRAAGYAPIVRDVVIPDEGGQRPVELSRIELVEEGAVEGIVVDGRGQPVAGVRVARDHVPTWLAVGALPAGMVVTDAHGRFVLRELSDGAVTLEAYAPDLGRARKEGVTVVSGRTTTGITLALSADTLDSAATTEPAASGNVAVTLGETGAPVDVVVVSVAEGSEAERGGLASGDILVDIDGAAVHAIKDARARLAGPVADDAVVTVRRGDQTLTLRIAREAVRR